MEILKKQKRKELFSVDGVDDTNDEQLLAERWVQSLQTPIEVDMNKSSSTDNSTSSLLNTGRSIAVWFPQHRVSVVVMSKGKIMSSLGVSGDGEICLLPEETLFLAEKRYLTLFHGGHDIKLKSFAEARTLLSTDTSRQPSSILVEEIKLECLSTNIERLYSLLTDKAGVSLECYLTYRTLRDRLKLIVRRHRRYLGCALGEATEPYMYRIQRQKELPDLPHYKPTMNFDESAVVFETFPWTTSFSKKQCGNPENRVVVVCAEDEAPNVTDLHALASLPPQPMTINSLSSASTLKPPQVPPSVPVASSPVSFLPPLLISMVDQEGGVSLTSISSPIKAPVAFKPKKQRKTKIKKTAASD